MILSIIFVVIFTQYFKIASEKQKNDGDEEIEEQDLLIYKNSNGVISVDAIYKDETLWLSQKGSDNNE